MQELYAYLWPPLAACFVAGATTGALARGPSRSGKPARWLIWALLALCAGAVAIALRAVEGALALYLGSALAGFVAFLVGAAAAAFALRKSLAAHERWALGLVPAALLWWGAVHVALPAYEAALNTPAPAQNAVSADMQGERPPEHTGTIPPAPAADAKTVLASLPSGPFDASTCQRALDAVASSEPVSFNAMRSTINRRAAQALDKAVEIIRRCPHATIEVRGHGDEGVEENTLSRRRALAVERYMRLEGVDGRRLVAVGCCEKGKEESRVGAIDYIVR
jgi:OmpA-OmpF porin, OOP family